MKEATNMNTYKITYRRFGEFVPRPGAEFLVEAVNESKARDKAYSKMSQMLGQDAIIASKIVTLTLVEPKAAV